MSNSTPTRRTLSAILSMSLLAAVLAGCGGGGGSAAVPPVQQQPPANIPPLNLAYAGVGVIKVQAVAGMRVALMERIRPFADTVMPDRILEIAADGVPATRYVPEPGWSLVDVALHPSRQTSLVLSNGIVLRLVRLDPQGGKLADRPFSDAQAAGDPYFGPPSAVRDRSNMSPWKTWDAVRIAALGEHLGMALRTGGNGVVAYRLQYDAANYRQQWRTLVEPGVYLDAQALRGGSFDPFQGLENHWQLVLGADERGRMAVAVLAGERTELAEGHRRQFGEAPPAGFVNGVLLTQVDAAGARGRTIWIDTGEKSEVHALAWTGDTILAAGRVRTARPDDGAGWDGWLAQLDAGSQRLASYRRIDVDRGDIVQALLPLGDDRVLLAGSTGYTQNPGGESVSEATSPLLAMLRLADGSVNRLALTAGPRGNQVRALAVSGNDWLVGGIEDAPGTHSADNAPASLTMNGYLRGMKAQ